MRLEGILLFLFVGVSMFLAALAVGVSALALVVLSRFDRMRRRPSDSRPEFLKRLLRGLSRKSLREIGDVHRAYRAFFGTGALRASHLEEIEEFLRGALHVIAAAAPGARNGEAEAKDRLVRELMAANARALEVERMCGRYSGTPELERGLLQELLALPAEDKTKARAALDTLARAIRFRQDTLERLEEESDRSLRLARWGWYGTLALAALALVLGFLSLGL